MLGVASSLILHVKGEVQNPAHELGVCVKCKLWSQVGRSSFATEFTKDLLLNTPPWSSDRDPQRRFPVFKRFGPLNLLTFFLGGGGGHPMSLSVFYPSEPNAYRRL